MAGVQDGDGQVEDDVTTTVVPWAESALKPGVVSRGLALSTEPWIATWAHERTEQSTAEFLYATIRNPHTRRAYERAVRRFAQWCIGRELPLAYLGSLHIAAYIEELSRELAPLSVKQHLAALKHWFDRLVVAHGLPFNPAQAVRGPRYSQNIGKTPVLEKDEAKALLSSIDTCDPVGARDAALVGVLLLSWARIGAVVAMKVCDYRGAGTPRAALLLHEKNGKDHIVPAHHLAAEYLDAFIAMAGLAAQPEAPLWQNAPGHGRKLSGMALTERGALDIVKRRCRAAGLPPDICNHSFRGTGLTLYMQAGGNLEAARQQANHASVKTTQLYDRSGDRMRKAEVERVQL